MTSNTDHDHIDRAGHAGAGSLATLAHRGDARGAEAVLDGARHDLRRHQHRRAAAAGTLAVGVLAGAVGAGALVLRDESPPVTEDSASGGGPSGTGSLVTGIRIEQHDVYDRIVIDFDGPATPFDPEGPRHSLPDTPECRGPADLQQRSIVYWGLRSAAATTGDGLVAGLSGRRIAGGPYAHEVVPLCAAEGSTWLAIVIDDPEVIPGAGGSLPDDTSGLPDRLDLTGTAGTGICHLADQVLIDFFTWPGPGPTPPSDEICPPPPA